ncbi:flavin-containing monooxygenase [Amycolatopsis sp. CA-230715]|uniref:flavin-containing monooxygenase n=1 Tax=Amycolatopsis sp. CA-230715 TaxID=2745196 RepID=UPI001C025A80|nr:NAD(P)/FAD-dependent oxidoreductase [Amycolatopsis sp. CA-230715]QWF82219.1 FAD-containing monooxygenase EthA [Amycolatopsis sp. CA-230715]
MTTAEHVDVLIVGAGLSGIGAACHLRTELPGKSIAILEARESMGGTWDLFRYPGIRSDSDMFTLGYRFKPWPEQEAIADGPSILRYVKKTAEEYGVAGKIRYGHRVVGAEWSTVDSKWTVQVQRGAETATFTCDFLFTCGGYYDYEEGYSPRFPGRERFTGTVVHPQHWPEDLDYAGKRVVVIGSGATAVTLVPAMAGEAAHVTMLQRSPTYIMARPAKDKIANKLRDLLPEKLAYGVARWKNVLTLIGSYQLSRRSPGLVKWVIRRTTKRSLPAGFDVDTHFKPRYDPWDQRLCIVPGGDLFRAIRRGTASVVTDTIDTFTERGIRLSSGEELEADIVITATGLNLRPFGGFDLTVDGAEVKLAETMMYKGMMLSGVPNFAFVIGYTNASWTLKADLVCEYVCRLLGHMDSRGYRVCVPERDPAVAEEPFMDLMSGYILRSQDTLPKQGAREPWRLRQNYLRDIVTIRRGAVEDEAMRFTAEAPAVAPSR